MSFFLRESVMEDYIVKTENGLELQIETKQNMVREKLIAQYIKCRKEKKMTQGEVADILGTKRPNITRFENGTYNPTLDFLVKVAEGMGMELEIKLVAKEEMYGEK